MLESCRTIFSGGSLKIPGVANGGIDLEAGGFYLGTWIADVGDGIEQDFYTGYVMELPSGLYLGAGFTSYQYSDDFDDEYNEVNLYAGWASDTLSLDPGVHRW